MFRRVLKSFKSELRDKQKIGVWEEKLRRGQNYLVDRFLMVSGVFRIGFLKQEVICLWLDRKRQICNGGIGIGQEEFWDGEKSSF